jgi:hypothetical protein
MPLSQCERLLDHVTKQCAEPAPAPQPIASTDTTLATTFEGLSAAIGWGTMVLAFLALFGAIGWAFYVRFWVHRAVAQEIPGAAERWLSENGRRILREFWELQKTETAPGGASESFDPNAVAQNVDDGEERI